MDFQKYSDQFLAKTLLPFIPKKISPNQVTWVRIISLPFIYYLLIKGIYSYGFILFSLSALTDAVDGAMARTRNQITELGKVLDPVADKGLIFLAAFIFIPKYFGWSLLFGILLLELFNALMAYRSERAIKMNPGANWAGKIKMIAQSMAFIMIFIGILLTSALWWQGAEVLLYTSLLFSLLECFYYPKLTSEHK